VFEIGNSLREARLRHGIDLVDAESATKIRSKYLRALEDERFELLPAPTYVRGFLRAYADFLGLDGQLYVDEYSSRYVVGEDEPLLLARRTSRTSRTHRRVESGVLLTALAGIAVATTLVFVAWKWSGDDAVRARDAISGEGLPTTALTPPPPAPAQPAPVRPAKAPTSTDVQLVARRGSCWVSVHRTSATGPLLFEGTLEQGQSKRFSGKRLWLNVGNPSNLDVRLNGKRRRLPGNGSEPVVVLASPRGFARADA
jgi:cytoskeletal protein RodZ